MRTTVSSLTQLALAAVISVAMLSDLSADHHEKDELSLSHIMKKGHKGKASLSAKAKKGEASEAELKRLIGMYLAMEKLSPPRGSQESWKEKTAQLSRTAIHLFAKREGAADAYADAVNCKACHKLHKEDN